MSDALRTLKIKTGVVKRLAKDVDYSSKESRNERDRLQNLKDSGGDEYEIRAQDKVIADADQMIPDYKKRLGSALEELEILVHSGEPSIIDTEELVAAKQVLQSGKDQLKTLPS